MLFFISKKKPSHKIIISLRSSSIGIQVVTINNNKLEVPFFERKIIFLKNSQDPQLYYSEYIKELSDILLKDIVQIKKIIKNDGFSINFVLYSPWFTCTITPVNHSEVSIINESFLEKHLSEVATNPNLYNLEKRVIKIQANGYTLNRLVGTKSSNVHLDVYMSYISNNIKTILVDLCKNYFPNTKSISYTTNPLLILDSIKRFMVHEDNVTFLYIDSEITQVGVIEDDSLSHFVTFPIGKHDFMREIEPNIKTYDYELLYQKEIQVKSDKQRAQFEQLKIKWAASIIESLKMYDKKVPSKILIITDSKTREFFTNLLTDFIKDSPSTILKNNRIINFDFSLLKDIIQYKTPVGESELDFKLEALI